MRHTPEVLANDMTMKILKLTQVQPDCPGRHLLNSPRIPAGNRCPFPLQGDDALMAVGCHRKGFELLNPFERVARR
jgi:hypothetical protein